QPHRRTPLDAAREAAGELVLPLPAGGRGAGPAVPAGGAVVPRARPRPGGGDRPDARRRAGTPGRPLGAVGQGALRRVRACPPAPRRWTLVRARPCASGNAWQPARSLVKEALAPGGRADNYAGSVLPARPRLADVNREVLAGLARGCREVFAAAPVEIDVVWF